MSQNLLENVHISDKQSSGTIHVGSKNNLVCSFMLALSLLYAAVVSTARQVWCHP